MIKNSWQEPKVKTKKELVVKGVGWDCYPTNKDFMFRCKNCKSIDKFELMFSPDYKGDKSFGQKCNKNKEIEITVDGYTFVPDLAFMNDHAVCRYCGQIYIWDYE